MPINNVGRHEKVPTRGAWKLWRLAFGWLWLLPAFAGDATLYVATDGDDSSGDGSQQNPYATITRALDNSSDGGLILVEPGTYTGRIRLRGVFAQDVTVRSQVPYAAKLRHNSTVITCFDGIGIVVEGFDIAHDGPGAAGLVVQIQDLRGGPGGEDATSRITIRNNIIHDSYNNDLLKINNGARDVLVEHNVFYNQTGSDEHMDVNGVTNVTIQDNIFFNDFAGSGRTNDNSTSSFIVIKNSGGHAQNANFTIRRNVFLNWEGSTGTNFLLLGEDGTDRFEAEDVLIENNLMLGNSSNVMRAAFGVKGGRNIVFRNNTISGDLPALAFAMRLNREGANPANENIQFYNNIWSDPTGTMGSDGSGANDFSDTPPDHTTSFALDHNLYWNGGSALPESSSELINPSDDANGVTGDPQLTEPVGVVLPRWDPDLFEFLSGNDTIRDEFERLVLAYAQLGDVSMALDAADPSQAPADDIMGQPRGNQPDIGAFELQPCSLVGDINGDLVVGEDDLVLALPEWPNFGGNADLDEDGRVTILDHTLLVNNFGECRPD
ncbi:DUF1565 domain-containing protein [Sulfidibacter corallicola]|uniref:DUF1565 domain-containing protein n=1 Tax=Sulfidibacter corallicola TaxID=2818388 RepID=A0A8A4U0S5_SULCO|nr:right-handed parallel beta-helix repeat-containing protein [Sulfidibacter corallicola]QTD52345.1 DUF1565 domain-containing protein [Sulfidibacter corallicola]